MTQQSVHQLYRRLETVGKGAYGSVHKGVHISSGNLVALKIINLDTADDDVEDIQREVALLTQLRDAPNVTKYFGCYLDGPRVWIIMELAQGGSVRDLMNVSKDGTLEEKYVVVVIREVLLGLSYLHKSSIIHRDIKAANILITAAGKVMICDFGVSALLATASSKRNTLMGTPNWMAPEVAQTIPAYDTRADIWSLGIMIYEMVKGSPPHVGIDKFKVIHLIPRVAPPRLIEGEGSKDMREFVSCCLKESPNDRLSADELTKTKWIKSGLKVSVTILKDLILRYEAWKQGGGSRDSLAVPLPWEEEEERSLQDIDFDDQNPWEFETVRGRPLQIAPVFEDEVTDNSPDETFPAKTIRPPVQSKLPSSLRLLFEDESAPQHDKLRPTLQISSLQNNAGISPILSSPMRDHGMKRGPADSGADDIQTAKQSNFAFPPRTSIPRVKSKASGSVPGSEDEDLRKERLPPLGPGIPPSKVAMSSDRDESGSTTASSKAGGTNYRDVRSTRGFPDIEIPSPFQPDINVDISSSVILSTSSPEHTAPLTSSSLPPINRKRSQSSITGTGPLNGFHGQRDRSLVSPPTFQFPPASSISVNKTHTNTRSTYASNPDAISNSPNAHRNSTSLDAFSTLQSLRPAPASLLPVPPSITRAHSANVPNDEPIVSESSGPAVGLQPLSRKPSINRQTSVAVMESVQSLPPLVAPVRPFARNGRDRSGSSAKSEGNISTPSGSLGVPGLRDVIKIPSLTSEHQLGMTDLLPPSPSAAMYNSRTFTPSPSLLGSSMTQSEILHQPPSLRSVSSASPLRSNSPDRTSATDSSQSPSHSYSHNNSSSFTSGSLNVSLGPVVRPLDYNALMVSKEATHLELARTVEDLTQWLSVVEVGLTRMLDNACADTIEEEQEEVSDDNKNAILQDESGGMVASNTNNSMGTIALVAGS